MGLWPDGGRRLSRDRARELALRLATELTIVELDQLYDDACEFVGEEWEYQGTDAGALWMVASGLPTGVRLVCDGVPSDVLERVSVASPDLFEPD